MTEIPIEIIAAVIGAAVGGIATAVGFVGRRYLELRDEARARLANAISELERLQRLLQESKTVYVSQNKQVGALLAELEAKFGDQVPSERGFDEAFFQMYDQMDDEQKELFHVIRGTTMHSAYQVNSKLREWTDTNSAVQLTNRSTEAVKKLDEQLMQLRLHLNGWFAKYTEIFKTSEKRSLVYLADEKHHGIGFPRALKNALADVLKELKGVSV